MNRQVYVLRDNHIERRVQFKCNRLIETSRLVSSRDIYNLLKKEYPREKANELYCEERDLDTLLDCIRNLADEEAGGDTLYEMAFKSLAKEDDVILSLDLLNELETLTAQRQKEAVVGQIHFKDSLSWAKATVALMREKVKPFLTPMCALLLFEQYLDRLGLAVCCASADEVEWEYEERKSYWHDELAQYYDSEEEIGELFDKEEI